MKIPFWSGVRTELDEVDVTQDLGGAAGDMKRENSVEGPTSGAIFRRGLTARGFLPV